ncbi:MAG: class I SAM-dependent methyltransferase [bacterium]|nr:class I SAM-dependent methyltransferase [bacterium]
MSEEFPVLFFDIFGKLPRQGPGDDASTLRALAAVPHPERIRDILDMGSGTGTPTMMLAKHTTARIVALDYHVPFLDTLKKHTEAAGFGGRIRTVEGDMAKPEFPDGSFDLIWSEGAIACAGFERGLTLWRPLLRDDGCVAVTDLCWFSAEPPHEIHDYLTGFYPGMMSVKDCLPAVERSGYRLLEHFTLPDESWSMEYLRPMEAEIVRQRELHRDDPAALGLLEMLQTEIVMYRKYSAHYGYAFFIAQKR